MSASTAAAPAAAGSSSSTGGSAPAAAAMPPVQPTLSRHSVATSAGPGAGKVRLDALLVGGQRHLFDFEPETTIEQVRRTFWEEWPADWPLRPPHASSLRILHMGHFLDDRAPLAGDGPAAGGGPAAGPMPLGRTTVVHVLIKPVKTESIRGDDESLKKKEEVPQGCCCVIC